MGGRRRVVLRLLAVDSVEKFGYGFLSRKLRV